MLIAFALALATQTALADRPFYTFVEQLSQSETTIQLDHFAIVASKNPRAQREQAERDLNDVVKLIAQYEKDGIPKLATPTDYAQSLQSNIDSFTSNTNTLRAMLDEHVNHPESRDEQKLWTTRFKLFHNVIATCWKHPRFSIDAINPAIFYNITPRLHEAGEIPILADPAYPAQARVGAGLRSKTSLIRNGDVVVAFWMPDDHKWIDVHTWTDIIKAPGDAADELTHQMKIKIRRGSKEVELSVAFVPEYQDVD